MKLYNGFKVGDRIKAVTTDLGNGYVAGEIYTISDIVGDYFYRKETTQANFIYRLGTDYIKVASKPIILIPKSQ